ncbi:MAG: transposase family protein [Firmicutes bacterium]|nr:transposase family protein [Bacillota bacterium]
MALEALVDHICKKGKNRFANPAHTASLLQQAARNLTLINLFCPFRASAQFMLPVLSLKLVPLVPLILTMLLPNMPVLFGGKTNPVILEQMTPVCLKRAIRTCGTI